jgi:hypothetical protein
MSKSALLLVVPNADYSAVGIGNFRTPLKILPSAMYALGSGLVSGTSAAVGDDLCGGLPLVKHGTPTDAASGSVSACSPGNWWTTQQTLTTLAAANSNNAVTFIAVGRCLPANGGHYVTTFGDSGYHNFACASSNLVSVGTSALNNTLGSAPSDRGTLLRMFAATIDSTSLQCFAQWTGGGGLQASTAGTITAHTITGATMSIGNSQLGNDGTIDVSCVAMFASKLTPTQITACFNDLSSWYASCGFTL